MKNLKKVLALVVAFSMMLCSVALAAFPDVEEGADYEVAVNTLAALGIISGDDQGNFNPDNSITRAEFTKIVCEIQGLKGDANKGATPFTDVAADHWASGYINMATNLKIINGMGDGTFAPEAPVTYEQAIKMLVVTLGYAPMAADRGGYPTGHLVVAQTYGMTKNITAPAQSEAAKRSLIAQIVYNTIDTPMMEQTGFGANITYEVKDGNNDRERTTLLTSKFDVVKLGGVVVANEKIAIDGSADKGEIALRYDNNFKSTNEDFELSGRDDSELLNNIEIGETGADELLGLRVIAYVRDTGKGYEVIAIVPEEGKNASITIDLNDIDTGDRTITEDDDDENFKLAYFKDDAATKSTQLKIENEYAVIWNSQESDKTLADIKELSEEGEVSAKLELVDWDDNGKYDLIKVLEVTHFVVAEIDEEDYEIKVVDSNEKFYLDVEEADYTITIKNAEGEIIGFEDIEVGDVIAVVSDGTDIDEPETFLDITVLGQSSVTGVVKSTRDGEVKVDGTWYEVDAAYEGKALTLGSEGTFYIGSNGKIVAFDGTKAVSGNYGMIVKALATDSDWSDSGYQVKILDAKGQVIIYDVAEKVKIRNNSDDEIDPINVELNDADSKIPADYFDDTVFAAFDAEDATLEALLGNFEEVESVDANKYQRMIQFKVNSSNEVTEIAPAVAFVDSTSGKYDADDIDIGTVAMDSSTVIFNVKNAIEDGKILTVDSLLNDADYTVAAFGYDDDSETYGAVAILDGGATLTTTVDGWAVVTAKSQITDENDSEAYEIEIVENGSKEAKTIFVTEDTEVDADYNTGSAYDLVDDEDFDIGSIILYTANAEGEVETLAVLANIVDDAFDAVADLDVKAEDSEYETTFAYGLLTGEADTSFEIADVLTEDEVTLKVRSTTNEYRYGYTGRKTVVNVGSYNGGDVEGIEDEDDTDTNAVFARLVNGKVVDIISIDVAVELD
ncbi:MAG: S-layer homology domain-containing protein [Ruminococcaceae bacterium]|nr:S-layer homology domain-containing protein [Oscillospiraceae bacterium]